MSRKIQEEALRTYLLTYSTHYASLSLTHLSTTFSLPIPALTSLISRMIYNEELSASLDQIDQVVMFHRVETTEVQRLAQQLAERVAGMVENNEKILDQKLGNSGQGGQGGPREGGERGEGGGRGRTERRGGRGGGRGGRGRGRGGFNSGMGSGVQRRGVAA
jgi:translation initiation factor 3 subunit C